jgi:hypothetical protein
VRPITPYPLVLIEWEDSARPIPLSQWIDDYELPATIRRLSVGYLISETGSAVALTPNLGDLALISQEVVHLV